MAEIGHSIVILRKPNQEKTIILSHFREKGWRKERDSNPRNRFRFSGFQDRRIRPLCHPSEDTTVLHCHLSIKHPNKGNLLFSEIQNES